MKKFISLFLVFTLLCTSLICSAADTETLDSVLCDTAAYIYEKVKNPQVSSIGGEWAVLGLKRSGYEIPDEYYENYYKTVENYVKDNNGILHERKYSEYSRVILALAAIGKNPEEVGGYNLLFPLADYDKTIWQGINGAIWALIALDSKGYEIPENNEAEIQATRKMYIDRILKLQLSDGGWSLNGNPDTDSDPDVTGMALQALAKYRDDETVEIAANKALSYLSKIQNPTGGFSTAGSETSESSAQVLIALCELGIAYDDTRFVKNDCSVLDNILSYYIKGNGFSHIKGGKSNQMATEQCFYALTAVKRMSENKNSLYNMNDVTTIYTKEEITNTEKSEKHTEVKFSFSDTVDHKNREAIEILASKGIINGKTKNIFEPDSTITRAEFAALAVKALNLTLSSGNIFSDVTEDDWFFAYVNTAYEHGIVKGISETEFSPSGTITKEEASAMLARAAGLCNINTKINSSVRDILAGFIDYITVSKWAAESLAICYSLDIFDNSELEIKPSSYITRAETAQSIYNLLRKAGKL